MNTEKIILSRGVVADLLLANTRNRPRNTNREAVFADAMKKGNWNWDSPQSSLFIINESRTWLLDGQTRLYAMQRAAEFGHDAILATVPDDEAEEVFKNIDTGRSRSPGSTLTALGVANGNTLAAIARIFLFETTKPTCYLVPANIVNEFVVEKEGKIRSLHVTKTHIGTKRTIPAAIYAGVLNAVRKKIITIDEASAFTFAALKDMGNENSATKMLSRYLQNPNIKRMSGAGIQNVQFVIGTKLAIAYKVGRDVKTLKVGDSEIATARSGDESPWSI